MAIPDFFCRIKAHLLPCASAIWKMMCYFNAG
jgi:hypothetical protein